MANENFQKVLIEELQGILAPIARASVDEDGRMQFFQALGWNLGEVNGLDEIGLINSLGTLATSIDDIINIVNDPPESFEEVTDALGVLEVIFSSIDDISSYGNASTPSEFTSIASDITNFLVAVYLERRSPLLSQILTLLTIFEPREFGGTTTEVIDGTTIVRYAVPIPVFHADRIVDLISSPYNLLTDYYIPSGSLNTAIEAAETSDLLFPRLAVILQSLGLHVSYGMHDFAQSSYSQASYDISKHSLTALFDIPDTDFTFGFTLSLSSVEQGNLGLVVSPFGSFDIDVLIGNWNLNFGVGANLEGFAIGPEGLTLPSSFSGTSISSNLSLTKLESNGSAFQIGSTTGTHLKIGGFEVLGSLNYSPELSEYKLQLDLQDGALVISAGDGDGFLAKILPDEGMTIDFDLLFGWSNLNGLYFEGSAGLELLIPIHKEILEVIRIDSVLVGIKVTNEGLYIFAGLDAGLEIGPFSATIERMGVKADISFPAVGGNIGFANADLGFLPPKGVGFSIDSSTFKGGGFLSFDHEEERYVGALELSIKDKVALKVIGILTTKLPGNDDGYSLLLLITAEFEPINLGFGFTLNGVGGLIALNRTMNLNYLRDGVKANTLDNILFPTDPIQNINQIISDLEGAFPVEEGRYSFGPMAIIGWGTPTLITVELGLMLELPSPVRLAVLGVLKAILPTEEKSLLKLQVNFLGTIDFEAKYITFDASIFASKLLSFTLEGDMAFRLKWGDNPNFLFSIGGFHPSYTPPPLDLPALNRLTINLLGGDNPRLTLTSYFAITSNTVQFGSAVDFYYKITNKYSVIGYLGFDILIQFNPFYLIASIAAQLSVMKNSEAVLSIYLGATVSGPAPWNVKGKAEFKVFGIKLKVDFDKTFGQPETTTLPNVDVLPRLIEAIENKANWQAINSDRSNLLVTLRELNNAPGDVVAHPFGSIGVSQKIVPLDMTINKFGTQRPADYQKFSLDIADGLGTNFEEENVQDFFAPAEYLEMSDSSKLTRKSFEEFNSGVAIKVSDELRSSYLLERELAYEQVIMDSRHTPDRVGLIQESSLRFNAFRKNGTAAKSKLGTKSKPKSENAPAKVSVQQEKYAIAHIDDMSQYGGMEAGSEAEARVLLEGLLESNPALTDSIQVVPFYEVA